MNLFTKLRSHPTWTRIKLPAAMLIALLQRSPAVRVLEAADDLMASSPLGAVLKSAVAAVASLGAMHSLAGATVLAASQSGPVNTKVGTSNTTVAFTVTNTINIASWRIAGSLPPGMTISAVENAGVMLTGPGTLDASTPGMDDGYGGSTGGNMTTTPVLSGVPTQAGNFTFSLQAFEFSSLSGLASNTFNFTVNVAADTSPPPTGTAPAFSAQPAGQSVTVGSNITFTAAASGSPTPTFQWQKNGTAISGQTSATLTLTNVQLGDAGSYTVIATNSAGVATATAASLNVTTVAPGTIAPAISAQPASQITSPGSTVVFTAAASGSPAPTYQWRKDGTPIAGATGATLVVFGTTAADAGTYTVVATNSASSSISTAATLTLSATPDVGRLGNLSIITDISAAAPDFTVGITVGGSGTSGLKPLLIRAAGPSLGALGVPGTLPDPKLELFSGSTVVAANDDWAGVPALGTAMAQVGAFPYASATSKDSAIFNSSLVSGGYTVKVSGNNGAGTVIAEVYDSTAGGTFSAATPRLSNVSVIKQIAANGSLTAGFVVSGSTSKTVLIRVVGPTLGLPPFGLGGVMVDPQLTLFNSSSVAIASNNDWGGDAQLATAGSKAGAFALANAASKDSVLLVSLPPGGYTATASGVGGAGGLAIVEVYEVP